MTAEIKFEVYLHPEVEKELNKFSEIIRSRIMEKINLLDYPFSGQFKHLKKNYYRVRSGNFRIIYQIYFNDKSVVVIRVATRKNAYKKL